MKIEYLVKMANEIDAFFGAEATAEERAQLVANHLRRFWDPRMRA
ncbi:MAG: formate dehydrogenase subunit delta, partial [Gammaproteobacteria bacterium]|nr:formate dehydrogenase subunit delta [Gammaproteobacteria bacterium]